MTELVEVKKSKIAGRGLFAKTNIKQKTKLLEYTGKHLDCNTKIKSHFLFEVKDRSGSRKCLFIIHGNRSKARFINHANTEKQQNAKFYQHKKRIYIKTIKPIKKGKELLIWYGKDTLKV